MTGNKYKKTNEYIRPISNFTRSNTVGSSSLGRVAGTLALFHNLFFKERNSYLPFEKCITSSI